MKKLFLVPLFLLCTLLMAANSAWALPALDFDDGNNLQTGVLNYAGLGGSLTGTDIIFDSVQGIGTPDNSGAILNLSGSLNFSTGNLSAFNTLGGGSYQWLFDGGGTFSLTGNINSQSPTGYDTFGGTSGTILSGSFSGVQFVSGNNSLLIFTGFGLDSKNEVLTDYFGLPANLVWSYASTDISADITVINASTGAFTANVTNADLSNVVPEPATMVISCLFLIGAGFFVRRKLHGGY